MARLSEIDRERIEKAVRDVERRTSCEFVAVLAASSGSYGFVRWGVPALVALAVPWLLVPVMPFGALDLLSVQLLAFALLASALQWPPLASRLVPRSAREEEAAEAARAEFHALEMSHTEGRKGVMLFVSAAEHYVEILVDRGVAEAVPAATWQPVVDRFVADVRNGRLAVGFERAIAACGDILARDFPPAAGDRNELPDRLVER